MVQQAVNREFPFPVSQHLKHQSRHNTQDLPVTNHQQALIRSTYGATFRAVVLRLRDCCHDFQLMHELQHKENPV